MALINIDRAIAEDRKITFARAANWRLYYDTAFGEQFAIPIWRMPSGGVERIALAADYVSSMQYHNNQGGNS